MKAFTLRDVFNIARLTDALFIFVCFCTVVIRCTETFYHPVYEVLNASYPYNYSNVSNM
jgi:hypothetical protein